MIISFKTLAKQWAFELVKYEVSTYNHYTDQCGLNTSIQHSMVSKAVAADIPIYCELGSYTLP